MKKVFLILGTLLLSLSTYAAMNVNKIDPPFWYTGMQNPELQLMVYGEGIGNAAVSVNYPGVSLSSTVKLESNNYLLVYLKLDKDVKPGKFNLTFTEGKKKLVKEYELKARNKKGCEHKGFDASDALYLLMPDRFANGNPDNDQIAGMAEYKVDRNDPNARHGGDLDHAETGFKKISTNIKNKDDVDAKEISPVVYTLRGSLYSLSLAKRKNPVSSP